MILYQNKSSKHLWFIRLDLPLLQKLPKWFIMFLNHFGLERGFLPKHIFDKYHLYNETIIQSQRFHNHFFLKNELFFHFLNFFHIPWVLSWKYVISVQDLILLLCHSIYFR